MPGRSTIWMIVGQGPILLAVGAGGGFVWTFSFSSFLSLLFLSLPLWDTARYRLKYCFKGPQTKNKQTKKMDHTDPWQVVPRQVGWLVVLGLTAL